MEKSILKGVSKLIIGLLAATSVAMGIAFYHNNQELIQIREVHSQSITGEIAERIKGLESTRDRMGEEQVNIEHKTAIKEEIETELIDHHSNYGLMQDAANILKEEIKDLGGLR